MTRNGMDKTLDGKRQNFQDGCCGSNQCREHGLEQILKREGRYFGEDNIPQGSKQNEPSESRSFAQTSHSRQTGVRSRVSMVAPNFKRSNTAELWRLVTRGAVSGLLVEE